MSDALHFSPADLEPQRAFLTRLARELVRGEAAADDLVQETFVRALERPPRAAGALGAWLRRVAERIAANQHRSMERRAWHERAAARPERVDSHAEAVASLELQQQLLAALMALDDPYRTTLWLRWHEGLVPRVIAQREGLTLKGVEARITRGLAALRAELDRRSGGERQRWFAGMATLAGGESAHAVSWWVGAWAMKKSVVAVASAAVVGGAAWWLFGGPLAPPPAIAPEDVGASDASPIREPGAVAAEREGSREDVPASPPPSAPLALADLLVRVVWGNGAPAGEVGLFVVPDAARHAPRLVLEERTVPDGTARFHGIAVGGVRIESDRGDTLRAEVVAGAANEVVLELADGIDVEGRVVDGAGAPVADAEVLFVSPRRDWLTSRVLARSLHDGRFIVRAAARGGHLTARAPGFVPAFLLPLDSNTASPLRDVKLVLDSRGVGVTGRVVDPEGRPVAGALVAAGRNVGQGYGSSVGGMVRQRFGMATSRSDDEGCFELSGVEHAELCVAVMAEGHPVALEMLPSWVGVQSYGEIALKPPATVIVAVRTSAGELLPGAEVDVMALDGRLAKWVPFPLPHAVTDERGVATLELVAPGRTPLRVTPPSGTAWCSIATTVDVGVGATCEVAVALTTLRSIRGRAVGGDGRPIEGAVVGWRAPRNRGQVVVADDGSFQIEAYELEPHELALSIGASGEVLAQAKDVLPGPDPVLLVAVAPASITGSFVEDSAARETRLTDVDMALLAETAGWETTGTPICFAMDRALEFVANATWNGDNFRCSGLPPGTYRLTIRNVATLLYESEWLALAAGETRDLGTVQSQRFRKDEPGAIEVALVPADARGVSGVLRNASYDATVFLRRVGDRWRAEGVLPGEGLVELRVDGRATQIVPFTVEPGATTSITARLEPGVARTLKFVGEWGDLTVAVRDEKDRLVHASRLTSLDPAGLLLMVADGRYAVTAVSDRGQRAEGAFEVRRLASQTEPLTFVLR